MDSQDANRGLQCVVVSLLRLRSPGLGDNSHTKLLLYSTGKGSQS